MAAGSSKSSYVATDVFLDSELRFGPFDTFTEFQELFPRQYRDHQDVRLLYKSFHKQRKLLQQQVKIKIEHQFENLKCPGYLGEHSLPREDLHLGDAVRLLEEFSEILTEECSMTRKCLKDSEEDIHRMCSVLREGFLPRFPASVDDEANNILQNATNMLT